MRFPMLRLALLPWLLWAAQAGGAPINGGGLQPGHTVIYPLFLIEDHLTTFRLTNNHPEDDIQVELVAICSGERSFGGQGFCAKHDRAITLTHNQTTVRNVRNFFSLDPAQCPTGFLRATAIGDPNFNLLSGSTYIRRTAANLPNATSAAAAIAIRSDGNLPPGTVLQSDFISTTNFLNPDAGRRSALALVNLDTIPGIANDATQVAIDWYSESEDLFSGSLEFYCHTYVDLHQINGGFRTPTLGSLYGSLEVTPLGAHRVLGQIREIEPNRSTLRSLYMDEARAPLPPQ